MLNFSIPLPALVLTALACWIFTTSCIAWSRFRQDKERARKGFSRIPERDLLNISMIGGWPGARLAQRRLRHKTRKEPFRSQLRLTGFVVLAEVALGGLLAFSLWGRSLQTETLAQLWHSWML